MQNPEQNNVSQFDLSDANVTNNQPTIIADDADAEMQTQSPNAETQKPVEANPQDRIGQKQTPKASKAPNPIKIMIGAVVGIILVTAIMVFIALSGDDKTAQRQQALQQQAFQQQMQAEQAQQQTDAAQTTETASAPSLELQPFTEGQVGGEIKQGGLVFDEQGEIASANTSNQKNKPNVSSTEAILANKDLKDYSPDDLFSAYQMLDFEATQIVDTQKAITARMKELGLDVPITQLEARQAIHDRALVEAVVAQLSDKMTKNMESLNQKMDALNQAQISLANDVSSSIADVMKRINVEDIYARKKQESLEQLTLANNALLSQYQIKQVASGRAWILDKATNKTNSYKVGDNIGNDIVIQEIDLSAYKVVTNKGEIKYQF